jgi:ATP-dependent Lon protease
VAREKDRRLHKVTAATVQKLLGPTKFRISQIEETDQVGMVTGLAWTQFGGELLCVETLTMPGKGNTQITGKLGDVMKESAQAAVSFVRSRAEQLGIDVDFYKKLDLHIHVPEGAIPKDGPSAGISMCSAIVSALAKAPVYRDLAMTGEITLRGRVLPIGGLKEKVLAAHRGGIRKIIIPKENEKDLHDIPASVLRQVEVVAVEHMDEVLSHAIIVPEGETLYKSSDVALGVTTTGDGAEQPSSLN